MRCGFRTWFCENMSECLKIAVFLGNHREQAARFFFATRIQERGRGLAVMHHSISVRRCFISHEIYFPADTGESTPQPPTFPHHNPVQKKRRPVCHQCINVRRRAAGLYLHSELSRAKGASGFPLMSCMQKRGGGIFMRDGSSVSGGVYFML